MDVGKLRNLTFIGHGGAGKTTLAEAFFYNVGLTNRLGRVDDGQTIMDYDEEEINRKISINLSVGHCDWKGYRINLLDTPGYTDFVGEVLRSLYVVDHAILVVDAVNGVGIGTEQVWEYASERNLPNIVFINKMDKDNAQFEKVVGELKEKLKKDNTSGRGSTSGGGSTSGRENFVCFQLPIGTAQTFSGIIDLIKMKAYSEGMKEIEVPKEMSGLVTEYREKLVEAAVEADDTLTEKYLEGEILSEAEIIRGLTMMIKEGNITPILCGSAYKNIGIFPLMEFICNFMPSPLERGCLIGINPDNNQEEERMPNDKEHSAAIVFKVITDPYVGELTLIRVYCGQIVSGMEVYNATTGKKERIGQTVLIQGKGRSEVAQLSTGEIGALVKFKGGHTGQTLCDIHHPIKYPSLEFPHPLISTAIVPKTKADQEKISIALGKLQEEDSTFKMHFQHEFGQTIISAMGELHLDIMMSRLKHKFGADVILESPRIQYRETIRNAAKGEGKYKKQTGGRGQYGHAILEIAPLHLNEPSNFEFVNKIFGGSIPSKYIPAIEKGVVECMQKGIIAGYPVVWIKVKLVDGSFHEVDSSDMAFQIAGSFALKDAFERAQPILIEPIMEVTATVPEAYTGDVIGDLNSRRGRILGMEPCGKMQSVLAHCPEVELYKYATSLRSITHGRGKFAMKFFSYEEMPSHLAEKIIAESK